MLRLDRQRQERSAEEGTRALRTARADHVSKAELCPVVALEQWLAIVGPAGAVFRTFDLRGALNGHAT